MQNFQKKTWKFKTDILTNKQHLTTLIIKLKNETNQFPDLPNYLIQNRTQKQRKIQNLNATHCITLFQIWMSVFAQTSFGIVPESNTTRQ
jgi:hypothetical protein